MINKKRTYTAGFTLVETLIAVLVLMTAITGPYTIAAKGLQATLIAKDQDSAFNLAQDAVEYVRFVRDTNILRGAGGPRGLNGLPNGHSTADGINNDCYSSDGSATCYVDALQDSISSCSGTCPVLNYDSVNGIFTYASANGTTITPSIFTRTMSITKCNFAPGVCISSQNAVESIVWVQVSWSDQGGVTQTGCPTGTRCISVREDLLNWQ